MINRIKSKLKENNGSETINFVIGLLILILLFSFVFDLFLITYKTHQVSKLTTNIVREIGKQSGIKGSTPYNFPGGNGNYLSVGEAEKILGERMNNLNLTNWDAVVKMDTNKRGAVPKTLSLRASSAGADTDYKGEITLTVTFDYEWNIWSSLVPGFGNGSRTITRTAFAEYKHDNSDWESEK